MRVLVVGGGGREHALVHSFAQSPLAERIFCAPGNAGTAAEADNIPIAADDLPTLLDFASRENVDLTVIGPEAPLVIGLTDLFEEHGLAVFGPNKEASQLEGSKVFAKEVMADGGVATGAYRRHERLESALADVEGRDDYPLVVKADGLAAGKGVLICKDKDEAREAVRACFVAREFGEAGDVLITEEYLTGSEVSLLVLCDGETAVPLAPAQDYKRIFAGDQGPNTGGMGSYCPVPGFEQKAIDAAMEHVVEPVVAALGKRGVTYRGVLYAGLIIFFCFFYTALVFNARETAENLKKSGAFIPGIRPGQHTAEYIDKVLTRLTVWGALYVAAVCLLPEILISRFSVPFYFGGTSLLIIVVVIMDFMAQLQAHLMSHQYEGLMKKANLRGYGRSGQLR